MAFWTNLRAFVTGAGYRSEGLQDGEPSSYSSTPAKSVTLDTALALSAVWACTTVITNSVASLPLLMERKNKNGGWDLETEHPLARLFSNKPNRWQTTQEFLETTVYQLVLLGNSYSAKQVDSKGNVIQLIPLMTQQMQVNLTDSGEVQFKYQSDDALKIYTHKNCWHNKLFGNGIIGLNPLSYARNSIGIGQAAEDATTKIYKNGGKPSGLLMIDKVISKEQRAKVKENFAEIASGNDDRLFVLEAGMKYEQVSLSPQDIELLASRRFQIEDIARFFGVPSVLINDMNAATAWGSGIAEIMEGWYKIGLRPYLRRLESSMATWLLKPEEVGKYRFRFDVQALLELTEADKVKAMGDAVQKGIRTPNEARRRLGEEPKAGGDDLYMQQQMLPIGMLAEVNRGKPPTNSDTNK